MKSLSVLGARVGAVAWLALVGVVTVMAERQLAGRVDDGGTAKVVSSIVMGLGFALTAVLLVRQEGQRGNAGLFALFALCWIASEWGHGGGGVLSAPLLIVGELTSVVEACIFLRYPGSRLDRPSRIYVATMACVLLALKLGMVLTSTSSMWTTTVPGLRWPTLSTDPGTFNAFVTARWIAGTVYALGFLVLMWRRWRGLLPLERRILRPVFAVGAVSAAILSLRLIATSFPFWLVYDIEVVRTYISSAVAVAFVVSAVRLTLSRVSVGDLAGRLAVPTWTSDGRPLAVVVATLDPVRHRALVDAAVAVSRLALENAMLHETLEAQVGQVREARARLLSTGVAQRRQLERDLHDGAQQRLLAIGLRLGAIENTSGDPRTAAAVRAVREDLVLAQDELRRLANGLYPAVLSQAGVGAALEEVANRLSLPVAMEVDSARWPPDVENAAYLIACEGLANAIKHAGATRLALRVAEQGRELVVEVVDDGRGSTRLSDPSALRSLRDRVEAIGGELRVASEIGVGTTVRAMLPCG